MQSDLFACQKKEEEAERDDRSVTMLNEVEKKYNKWDLPHHDVD